jgi:uncharacterized protein (DUF362 family)
LEKIGIFKDKRLSYDSVAPFHPAQAFPEYPFKQLSQRNSVYEAVRKLFHQLKMDVSNYGTALWNPLGQVVKPGDRVLIKPNFVMHFNRAGDFDCMCTHGSVIRAVLDYVYIALKGRGQIIIADAPLQSCNFAKLVDKTGLDRILDFYRRHCDLQIKLMDLRLAVATKDMTGFISTKRQEGDLVGYVAVDLKNDSELSEICDDYEKFRVTCYNKEEMTAHHNREKNEYLIPQSVLSADVIINLPKLKAHRKAGMTCSMKNLVGINGFKDWLPHHRFGSKEEGGDEYLHKNIRKEIISKLADAIYTCPGRIKPRLLILLRTAVKILRIIFPCRDRYLEGSWYGNDTLPRTIADLNRIALYADKEGRLQKDVQRRMFVVVDAIVAGEKEGPLKPSPKHCGLLVAGYNPVTVDLVCSRVMGFDWRKIGQFKYALKSRSMPLFEQRPEEIEIAAEGRSSLGDVYDAYGGDFTPTKGWKGHIERE